MGGDRVPSLRFGITQEEALQLSKGPYRERPESLNLHRYSGELEVSRGYLLERREMFHDQDAATQEHGMDRPTAVLCAVNVVGIDPHQRHAGIGEKLCRFF